MDSTESQTGTANGNQTGKEKEASEKPWSRWTPWHVWWANNQNKMAVLVTVTAGCMFGVVLGERRALRREQDRRHDFLYR